ncbi:glycoside hydrolase family 13 protein [Oenococcus alcoholitolerans]|uniref:glycoside hydrolase family 13 protein n=1 Tax=Oenococcus alcoholitolerans TaxID=931074 RepID=UPI003F70662C
MLPEKLRKQVIYQIYPRSFKDSNNDGIGDLNGIRSQMDYLACLGVTMLWLTPIFKSPNRDNGYDVSNYYEINPEFGSESDLEKLIDSAHSKNISIMLDMVFNHTSDQHDWFQKSRAREYPYTDFYIWKDGVDGRAPKGKEAFFGGDVWQFDDLRKQYYYHTFDKKQPDLNWSEPLVRKKLADVVNYWIKKGVAGFRFDAIDYIGKKLNPIVETDIELTHKYLNELKKNSYGQDNSIITVGETGAADLKSSRRYTDFKTGELDMVFQFEFMNLDGVRSDDWIKKEFPIIKLKKLVDHWQKGLFFKGWSGQFLGSHDFPRLVSRFGSETSGYRFLSASMLATFLFGLQGTPYIYQGDEIGMSNFPWQRVDQFRDIESLNFAGKFAKQGLGPEEIVKRLADNSRDNARTPFQWSNDQYAGFSNGKPWLAVNPNFKTVNVQREINDNTSLLNYYRRLIKIRKQETLFFDGDFKMLDGENDSLFFYERFKDDRRLLVVANFSEKRYVLENKFLPKNEKDILIANYSDRSKKELFSDPNIRPFESFIYLLDKEGRQNDQK